MFYALCLMLHITYMFTFSVTMSSICHPSPICMLFLIVYYFASSSMFNESLPLFKPSCFIGYYASSSMLHVPYSCTFFCMFNASLPLLKPPFSIQYCIRVQYYAPSSLIHVACNIMLPASSFHLSSSISKLHVAIFT